MAARPWWQGSESILNEKAVDFIFAVWGLRKAYDRLVSAARDDVHQVIECAWWIGAATEACGRRHSGGVLEGFYWVRNKGLHELRLALGRIQPREPGSPAGMLLMGVGGGSGRPQRWLSIRSGANGSASVFNEHLAERPVAETVSAAFRELLEVAHEMIAEAGFSELPEFQEIFRPLT